MRALVCPLELKGTLTAAEAANAIAEGLKLGSSEVKVELLPWADGGPGSLDLLVSTGGGEIRSAEVRDPLGRVVSARWGLLDLGATAVVEMAETSGLWRLAQHERDPKVTSSYGTGQLMGEALRLGCEQILVCIGGSATNDAGAGALRALGLELSNMAGEALPEGGIALGQLARVGLSHLNPRLKHVRVTALVDVSVPLLGPRGATRTFAPQKGASAADVEALEYGLARFASLMAKESGARLDETPRAGAGGGMAFGLMAGCRAQCRPAFELFAERTQLQRRIQECDVLLTAEGRLDTQTLLGKGPFRLAQLARSLGKPSVLFAGSAESPEGAGAPWSEVRILSPGGPIPTVAESADLLRASARAWIRSRPHAPNAAW
jgi:glycerate kinase